MLCNCAVVRHFRAPADLLLMRLCSADLTFSGSPAGPPILGVGVGAFTFTVRKVRTVPIFTAHSKSSCRAAERLTDAGHMHSVHVQQLMEAIRRQDCRDLYQHLQAPCRPTHSSTSMTLQLRRLELQPRSLCW